LVLKKYLKSFRLVERTKNMATLQGWLVVFVMVIKALPRWGKETVMGWFRNSPPQTGTVAPASTPAVDPGATPDPSNVASATTVVSAPDPVTPVTASAATFPTAAPANADPGTVYPVAATPDVRAPQTPTEWWAVSKDSYKQARKRLSWQEVLSYVLQIIILWAAGFVLGPTMTFTSAQVSVIVVTTIICSVSLWSLFWKFWVPDERAAQHFGADRVLDAILQLLVAGVAFLQLILIMAR
jgi:hypothetical protein